MYFVEKCRIAVRIVPVDVMEGLISRGWGTLWNDCMFTSPVVFNSCVFEGLRGNQQWQSGEEHVGAIKYSYADGLGCMDAAILDKSDTTGGDQG